MKLRRVQCLDLNLLPVPEQQVAILVHHGWRLSRYRATCWKLWNYTRTFFFTISGAIVTRLIEKGVIVNTGMTWELAGECYC